MLLALTFMGRLGFMCVKYLELTATSSTTHCSPALFPMCSARRSEGHGGSAGTTATTTPSTATSVVAAPAQNPDRPLILVPADGPEGLAVVTEAADETGHELGPEPRNVQIFFGIYFMMTGLHGIHVLVGMGMLAWAFKNSLAGAYGPTYFTPVEIVGIYWHLVDLMQDLPVPAALPDLLRIDRWLTRPPCAQADQQAVACPRPRCACCSASSLSMGAHQADGCARWISRLLGIDDRACCSVARRRWSRCSPLRLVGRSFDLVFISPAAWQ
ncbi:MAG: cytochrome c oxidase subunit 3 [Acidobacteriota bacterium]